MRQWDADPKLKMKKYSEVHKHCVLAVKVKVHTLDIAPLHNECESPPQKCSGMARVLKGFHSFTCTRSSAIGMSYTCLCLPSYNWPRRDGRLSRPWCEVAQAEIQTCNSQLQIRHSTTQPLAHL